MMIARAVLCFGVVAMPHFAVAESSWMPSDKISSDLAISNYRLVSSSAASLENGSQVLFTFWGRAAASEVEFRCLDVFDESQHGTSSRCEVPKKRENEMSITTDNMIGGPFSLIDTNGNRVTEKSLDGRPHAILFGYTRDINNSSTILSEMSRLFGSLGPNAPKLDVYFVSVDPNRDDPETLKSFLSSFSSRIKGLTGTDKEIMAIASAYKIYLRKVPTGDGDYSFRHTPDVFLFGADGRFRGTIRLLEDSEYAIQKLKRLID